MSLAYIAGENIIQEYKYQGMAAIEVNYIKVCLPQQLCTYYFNFMAKLML